MNKKKTPEELDEYLKKFAFGDQKKLVNQLRQMIKPEPRQSSDSDSTRDNVGNVNISSRDDFFLMMDSHAEKSIERFQYKKVHNPIYLEILVQPVRLQHVAKQAEVEQALRNISTTNKAYSYTKGTVYTRDITVESNEDKPNIFDPKSQAIFIAGILRDLGIFYRTLGYGPADVFDIVFRYGDATNLAVGSIGTETFMPSRPFANRHLTLYVVRALYEIAGGTKELSAEIIIELLKKLNYQGIVNKDFFIHAVSKQFAKNRQS